MIEQSPNPIDWNGKLSVVNGSPLSKPYPTDRLFWIVVDEAEFYEVAYDADASFWTRRETYSRQDGESGSWAADEIMGWTDSQDDAEEAATLLMEFVGVSRTIPTTCIETIGGDPATAIRLSHQIKVF